MIAVVRVIALCALLVALAAPAIAHSLRVFVTAEGQVVRGYGFFVGGGRPRGAAWRAESGDVTLATGTTDADGAFGFVLPGPVSGDIVVTVDPGDGHGASATLPIGLVGARATVEPPVPVLTAPSPVSNPAPMPDPALIEAAVDRAVARQVEPILIRIEEMDARMRLTDLVSGGMAIFGLAGIALWLRGRGR